jgi:hypothetical protein
MPKSKAGLSADQIRKAVGHVPEDPERPYAVPRRRQVDEDLADQVQILARQLFASWIECYADYQTADGGSQAREVARSAIGCARAFYEEWHGSQD